MSCFFGNNSKDFCGHKTANTKSNQFTQEDIALLQAHGGNGVVNSKYLAKYGNENSIQTNQRDMLDFIKKKYIKKEWYLNQQPQKGK